MPAHTCVTVTYITSVVECLRKATTLENVACDVTATLFPCIFVRPSSILAHIPCQCLMRRTPACTCITMTFKALFLEHLMMVPTRATLTCDTTADTFPAIPSHVSALLVSTKATKLPCHFISCECVASVLLCSSVLPTTPACACNEVRQHFISYAVDNASSARESTCQFTGTTFRTFSIHCECLARFIPTSRCPCLLPHMPACTWKTLTLITSFLACLTDAATLENVTCHATATTFQCIYVKPASFLAHNPFPCLMRNMPVCTCNTMTYKTSFLQHLTMVATHEYITCDTTDTAFPE
jgi:hypothetical protein